MSRDRCADASPRRGRDAPVRRRQERVGGSPAHRFVICSPPKVALSHRETAADMCGIDTPAAFMHFDPAATSRCRAELISRIPYDTTDSSLTASAAAGASRPREPSRTARIQCREPGDSPTCPPPVRPVPLRREGFRGASAPRFSLGPRPRFGAASALAPHAPSRDCAARRRRHAAVPVAAPAHFSGRNWRHGLA